LYAGLIVGNAITDAAGKAPSSADTKVLPDTDGVLRLNGYKFYSTGTLFADVIAVSALDVNDHEAIPRVFGELSEELGGIDRVIVNAGIGKGWSRWRRPLPPGSR